jgi:quinolinate synthase
MSEIINEIKRLKAERNAVILAHNYVNGEVQDIADFVGDSLELSIKAQNVNAPVIVFCGVSFMAETAKILSPASKVLLPVMEAGCQMADMATAEAVAAYRQANPDTVLVAYVNTTAAVKAEVDICCTSANAEKVVKSIPADKAIMFLPDRNLGANISKALGRTMELWPGYCPIHDQVLSKSIQAAREKYPDAKLMVHPECPPEILALADIALSTGGMLRVVKEAAPGSKFIVGTEYGIMHRLEKENPDKVFYPLEPLPTCCDMKKITLEDVRDALKFNQHVITLSADVMENAVKPIEKMLAL